MSELIFLHCDHMPNCNARIDKHFEGYSSLQWMENGALELFYDDARFELNCLEPSCFEPSCSEETTHFWPAFPGPRIRFHAAREFRAWNHRYAALSGPRLEGWKRAGIWPTTPQTGPRGRAHAAQWDELLALIKRGGTWGTRRAGCALEAMLLELAEARAQTQTEAPWLAQSRQFLAETTDFAPDYARLARELGLGLSTLRRNFRAQTGMSLHEALLQNRLDKARSLLGETDLPLKKIAADLGYRDVHFFSNQFKTLAGVSPAAYRKSRQS